MIVIFACRSTIAAETATLAAETTVYGATAAYLGNAKVQSIP